jgi:tetrahydromethanopterin S-methyltransferase subunit B
MIRELQSRSQCKIQVDHSGSAGVQQNEKQVMLTGTEQAVTKAKEMVLFLVANPLYEGMQAIQMLVEDKLHHGGVWGSGPPYVNMPNHGQNMQPNSGNAGGYGGYDQQSAYGGYSAPAAGGYGATAATGGYGAAAQAYSPAAAAPAYGAQYGAPAGGGGMEMEMFMASKNYMGRIIGQKGVTINDLQRRSSCDIQINQDVAHGQDCEITIKGTRQGIEMAKSMLREIIEVGPGHPYAGGRKYNAFL